MLLILLLAASVVLWLGTSALRLTVRVVGALLGGLLPRPATRQPAPPAAPGGRTPGHQIRRPPPPPPPHPPVR